MPCQVTTTYTTTTQCYNCPPEPCASGCGVTCASKYCTDQPNVDPRPTSFSAGEQAPVLVGGSYASLTPYESCDAFVDAIVTPPSYCGGIICTNPWDPGCSSTPICTNPYDPGCSSSTTICTNPYDPGCSSPDNTCQTTVTYTYTTDGALIVVATSLQAVGCGPFHYNAASERHRFDGGNPYVFFWLWAIAAGITGLGMIVL